MTVNLNPSAPQIQRRTFDSANEAVRVNMVAGTGGTAAPNGRSSVGLARIDYGSTPVTTAAYVQLIASLADVVNELFVFESSGQTLVLAVGAAGFEVDQIYIPPGGNGSIPLRIASGSRVSVKAVNGNANVANTELNVSFLK